MQIGLRDKFARGNFFGRSLLQAMHILLGCLNSQSIRKNLKTIAVIFLQNAKKNLNISL